MAVMTAFVGTYVLPQSVRLSTFCFGKRYEVRIRGQRVALSFPCMEPGTQGEPPRVIAPDLQHLPQHFRSGVAVDDDEPVWGYFNHWNSATGQPIGGGWVAKVGLETQISGPIDYSDYMYGLGRPSSPEITQLYESIDGWFDLLLTWIGVVVRQDTHYLEPLRGHSVEGQGLAIRAVLPDGRISLPQSANLVTIFSREAEVVNLATLRLLLKRTSDDLLPSDPHLLLRDGYIDLRRGRLRKAVINGGSAAESALATWCLAMSVTLPSRPTLGWFVQNSGAPIPATTKADLVDIRNDAIHQGINPSIAQATQALAVSDAIVRATHLP
jgi:hypothetical protein